MNRARRLSLTPVFTAIVAWLASGGVEQLRDSLGRQWVQRVGLVIGVISLLGLWGIDTPYFEIVLTVSEFQAGIGVAAMMIALDFAGTVATLLASRNRADTIDEPKLEGAVKG